MIGTTVALSISKQIRAWKNRKGPVMLNENHATISSVQHLRHDLMIELGRLEMAMDDFSERTAGNDPQNTIENLQSKHARVSAALDRLPQDR